MKRFYFALYSMLLLSLTTEGQNSETIRLPSYRPLKCGFVKKINDTISLSYINPIRGIQIYTCSSKDDSVFSLSSGKVLAVEKVDDEFVCVIKKSNIVVIYNKLISSPLKKGATVRSGDYIGKMYDDDHIKLVRIVIRDNNKILSFDKHLSYIMNKLLD